MSNMFLSIVDACVPLTFRYFKRYFKFKKRYKKFRKDILRGSPSIGVLWAFAEFIKYAEVIFFYDNSKSNRLYSSNGYIPGENGFKIFDKDNYIITIKLFTDTQKVGIDVENINGGRKTNYTFINNEWVREPDAYDILFIDRITAIITKNMIWLLDECIKKRKSDF